METTKETILLEWSQTYPLENFNKNDSLKEKLTVKGIYLNIISMNGFNRITYVGESGKGEKERCILNRLEEYYKAYHCNNDNEYHTMDLNKIKGDPYEIYTGKNDNSVVKIINKVYFPNKTFIQNCPEYILEARRDYFDKCFISFVTNEKLKEEKFRKGVQRNLQQFFINSFGILNYNNRGDNFIGRNIQESKYFDPTIVIINNYADTKLSNLPFRIEF